MRRRNEFVPTSLDRLESRVVLSRMAPTTSVVLGGLCPRQGLLNRQQQSAAAEINQVFDTFVRTLKPRTCWTWIPDQPNPSPATINAFAIYTTQRVSLMRNRSSASSGTRVARPDNCAAPGR